MCLFCGLVLCVMIVVVKILCCKIYIPAMDLKYYFSGFIRHFSHHRGMFSILNQCLPIITQRQLNKQHSSCNNIPAVHFFLIYTTFSSFCQYISCLPVDRLSESSLVGPSSSLSSITKDLTARILLLVVLLLLVAHGPTSSSSPKKSPSSVAAGAASSSSFSPRPLLSPRVVDS